MTTIATTVESIKPGNRVDLESCPFLNKHPTAKHSYAVVEAIAMETEQCTSICYEGIDTVGYPLGTQLQVYVPKDVPDPVVRVQEVGTGAEVEWKISLNLTDRWGEINNYYHESKPLEFLENDDLLLERLQAQMWDESTFIVRKDGQFGILFEVEFCSKESEANAKEHDPTWYATLKPHQEMVAILTKAMRYLTSKFPGVLFAVPDPSVIVCDRPAAWAFVPDGLLDDDQREQLGNAMLDL